MQRRFRQLMTDQNIIKIEKHVFKGLSFAITNDIKTTGITDILQILIIQLSFFYIIIFIRHSSIKSPTVTFFQNQLNMNHSPIHPASTFNQSLRIPFWRPFIKRYIIIITSNLNIIQ